MVKRAILSLIYSALLLLAPLCIALEGIDYRHLQLEGPLSIHILEVDPHLAEIKAAHAGDSLPCLETTSSIAERHRADAAVNGGFFYVDGPKAGQPDGLLKIENQWLGFPKQERAAIGWNRGGLEVLIDRIAMCNQVIFPLIESENNEAWQKLETIVGGTPVLISQERLILDFSVEKVFEKFLTTRHPRTALGIKSNGNWVFAVVDGRHPQISVGMTMKELATFMVSLGCIYALNLDGGGSSTLYFDGRVRNFCSGEDDDSPNAIKGEERPVTDAILIHRRCHE